MTDPPLSSRARFALRALVVLTAVGALAPLGRTAMGWWEYTQVLGLPLEASPPRGTLGVRWVDGADGVRAAYVAPSGPAAAAGVRENDRLVEIDFQPVFSADDADAVTYRATGTVLAITVLRNDRRQTADVAVAEAPTFLYPVGRSLWAATGWGFALAALLHLLALLSVLPIVGRAARARGAAVLIGVALLWVGGNLLRHLWITAFGPPSLDGPLAVGAFRVLTLVSVLGWVLFPALLLRRALVDQRAARQATRRVRWALWMPAVLLGGGLTLAVVLGHLGPLPPDAFARPILFYVCVYVASATGLSVWLSPRASEPVDDAVRPTLWSRAGSALVLALSVIGALFSLDVLPVLDTEVGGAWLVVALQLFSLLPIALVTLATLRHGRLGTVFGRGLTTAGALAVVFVLVVLGALVVSRVFPGLGRAGPLALGAWTVVALLLAERLAPSVRGLVARTIGSRRDEIQAAMSELAERARLAPDAATLAQEAAERIGAAMQARSAAVFLRARTAAGAPEWVRAGYRPEPPLFTVAELERVWGRLRESGRVWSRNAELDEARLPSAADARLREIGVALAVPITDGEGQAVGLIALGRKERRFSVYNLDDAETLRTVGGQLALATERLALLERERALVRQTAEAELTALRAQINPHFLFNALNTIAALIAERPDEAEATVETLAGLFRDVLTASGKPFVPLGAEMRLVERYLSVEQARFGERLRVEIEVAHDVAECPVPAFAVQTLVENAVKHGIEPKRGGGAVSVSASQDGDTLRVTVADTGVGIPSLFGPPEPGDPEAGFHGVGLSNVRTRLRQLYGVDGGLSFQSSPDGTTATLALPLHASGHDPDLLARAASSLSPSHG